MPVQRKGGNQTITGNTEFRRERLPRKEEKFIDQAVIVRADTPHSPIRRPPVPHFIQRRDKALRRLVVGHKARAARLHPLPKRFRLDIVHLVSRRDEAAHQAERGVRVSRIRQIYHQNVSLLPFHPLTPSPAVAFLFL